LDYYYFGKIYICWNKEKFSFGKAFHVKTEQRSIVREKGKRAEKRS
jgi:hypothetical protein